MCESPNNLPASLFGKLAEKSKDQINRELKATKLLTISLGNRGQRITDWQLVPFKQKLARMLMSQFPHMDSWGLYRMLTQPHPDLCDRAAIDAVTPTSLPATIRGVVGGWQHAADASHGQPPQPISEVGQQAARRLMDNAVVLEDAQPSLRKDKASLPGPELDGYTSNELKVAMGCRSSPGNGFSNSWLKASAIRIETWATQKFLHDLATCCVALEPHCLGRPLPNYQSSSAHDLQFSLEPRSGEDLRDAVIHLDLHALPAFRHRQ